MTTALAQQLQQINKSWKADAPTTGTPSILFSPQEAASKGSFDVCKLGKQGEQNFAGARVLQQDHWSSNSLKP